MLFTEMLDMLVAAGFGIRSADTLVLNSNIVCNKKAIIASFQLAQPGRSTADIKDLGKLVDIGLNAGAIAHAAIVDKGEKTNITPTQRKAKMDSMLRHIDLSALDCNQDIELTKALRTGLRLNGYFGGDREFRDFLDDLCASETAEHLAAITEAPLTVLSTDPIDLILAAAMRPQRDMCSAVLRHTVWQVKRKMLGLEVDNHLAAVLYGAQGGGKSKFVEAMLSPLHPSLWGSLKLNELGDERALSGIASKYVNFSDEMEGASKTDINSLKSFITSKTVDYRPMGSNGRQSTPNKSTIICATNVRLKDQIKDTTGMRRYFEIECLPLLNWAAINRFNWTAYWASVDPHAPSPLVPHLAALKVAQAGLVRDPMMEWLDIGIKAGPTGYMSGGVPYYTMRELADDLAAYAKSSHINMLYGDRAIGVFLKEQGWSKVHQRAGNVWVSPDSMPMTNGSPSIVAPVAQPEKMSIKNLLKITALNTSTGYPGADDEEG